MQDIYAVIDGNFGKVVVRHVTQNLVTHAHSQIQLGYWLGGGTANCRVGEQETVFTDGLITACNSYESHDMVLSVPSEPVIALFLYIDVDWLDESGLGCGRPIQFSRAQLVSTPDIKTLSAVLMRKVLSSTEVDSLGVEADVKNLLRLTVEQAVTQTNISNAHIRRRMPDYRLRLALSYMTKNIACVGLMGHVAQVVGLSRSRLYELFFDEIKSSPKVIWNSIRTDEAMHRIATCEDSMAAVASQLGFSSAGNFSRFFKANVGLSPLCYRKMVTPVRRKKPQIYSIIYTSTATSFLSNQELEDILKSARQRNEKYQVTGVLLYADGRFMQYLEGALADLDEVLGYVKSAKQHSEFEFREVLPVERRAYKNWSMAFVSPSVSAAVPLLMDRQMSEFLNQSHQRA